MTLSPVYHCFLLKPFLIDPDHCTPKTPHKSCFGDPLTVQILTLSSNLKIKLSMNLL